MLSCIQNESARYRASVARGDRRASLGMTEIVKVFEWRRASRPRIRHDPIRRKR
jgi:hypothetical protein